MLLLRNLTFFEAWRSQYDYQPSPTRKYSHIRRSDPVRSDVGGAMGSLQGLSMSLQARQIASKRALEKIGFAVNAPMTDHRGDLSTAFATAPLLGGRPVRRRIAVFVVSFLMLAGAPLTVAARECLVERAVGRDIQVSDGGRWQTARIDQVLTARMRIRTGSQSRVRLRCDDATEITIGPSSLVDVGSLVGSGQDNVLIRLSNGIIGIVAPQRTWRSFRVKAPTLIASVRSTTWLVEAVGTRSSAFVRTGTVDVATSAGITARLGPGDGLDADAGGGSPGRRQWSGARIAAAERRIGLGW